MQRFLLVCGAGGLGSGARYLVGLAADRLGETLPWGTLIVNIAGSFLIAVVYGLARREVPVLSTDAALVLATGFLGGFTTYSAFNYQTTDLATQGHAGRAVINVVVTLVGCLAAGLAGVWLARRIS